MTDITLQPSGGAMALTSGSGTVALTSGGSSLSVASGASAVTLQPSSGDVTIASGSDTIALTSSPGALSVGNVGSVSWPLLAPDGSLSAPSYSWANDTDLGLYKTTNGFGASVGGVLAAEFVAATIDNLEPTSNEVAYGMRAYPHAIGSSNESAALYMRTSPGSTQENAIYLEVDDTQIDTAGAAIKVIHQGAGDAVFIASFSSGAALETASFHNGSTGFISTCQWEADNGNASDFGNTTCFNAVFGYDGTGGSTTPANFGVFYAARTLGNAFRVRMQDPDATGFAWGRPEFHISSFDLARSHYQAFNTGDVQQASRLADASFHRSAPWLKLVGSYWNGAAAVDKTIQFLPTLDISGNSGLGISLDATTRLTLEVAGGRAVLNYDTLNLTTARTITNSADSGNDGDFCSDSSYIYFHRGGSWRRVAIATW